VDQFGASRRRQGLEASSERGLHLVEGHGWTLVVEADAVRWEWIRAVEKRRAALGRRGEWQQEWQQTQLGFPGVAGNPR
jgi:hypothetical protein